MSAHTRSHRKHLRSFLIVAIALALAACAGTQVRNVRQPATGDDSTPPKTIAIIVDNDNLAPDQSDRKWLAHVPPNVRERYQARQLAATQTAIAYLQKGLATALAGRGLRVVPPAQPADLTLHCGLEEVRPGVGGLRVVLGLGTGKAILRVRVALVESERGMHSTLLTFDTRSTTGSMPGAAVGPVPGGVALAPVLAAKALGVASGLKSGLPEETHQTIQKIDEEMRAYFSTRNWPYPLTHDSQHL